MFRKRTKKAAAKSNLRRKRRDDEDPVGENVSGNDESEGDAAATSARIRSTLKKQKILATLPMTSGGGSGRFRASAKQNRSGDDHHQQQDGSQAAELSVLDTKHKNNMESFIEERMASSGAGREGGTGPAGQPPEASASASASASTEDDLYRSLAREVAGETEPLAPGNEGPPEQDGDQGAGGAALLGGTGIAEVILPSTRHEPVALFTGQRGHRHFSEGRSSAVPEGERHGRSLPETTPKPLVRFSGKASANLLETKGSSEGKHGSRREPSGGEGGDLGPEDGKADADRKGFDAFRGRAAASSSLSDQDPGGGDDRTRHNRWKTGQNRDDVVYRQFLKKALNPRNI